MTKRDPNPWATEMKVAAEMTALRTALAAADRLAEACFHEAFSWCDVCGQAAERDWQKHDPTCPVAAYLAAREETR